MAGYEARYTTEQRVAEAARPLATTKLPPQEISQRCGFTNADHFGKVFRRFRNTSPGAFGRSVRETKA
ncbi:MAG: helix-turn-helix domain-containing protein [Deltaproteobacteria bacterium]|nr:helix-turn-helix domain-containing protein [Deltaproteobacteria bacterium]